MNEPSHEPQDKVVVLTIPRRLVKIGFVALTLVVLGVVAAVMVHNRTKDNGSTASYNRQNGYPLPPPVTFIPPTSERQIAANRFLVSPDDDPATGPENAPIVIIEFSDFQCHYCALFARETLHPLLGLYPGQIRFVYRDFVANGPLSLLAGIAAECANEQDAFWAYHNLLFEFQDELSRDRMLQLARSTDLDLEAFSDCLDNPAFKDEVRADTRDGEELGVRGTPTFFINGRVLVGAQPLSVFVDVIDEELARVGVN